MKSLMALIGFLAGAAAAAGFLLNNPLQPDVLPVPTSGNVYDWNALDFHGESFAASSLLNLPVGQMGEAFVAEGIANANAAVLLLTDSNGQPAALATRLVAINEEPDMLRSTVGVSSYINIIWPNYGSILMFGQENRWPLIRTRALELAGLATPVAEPSFVVSSAGSVREVAGGSGAFAGMGGRYTTELRVDADKGDRYAGRLGLELQTSSE